MLELVISGGQTGVDQAALKAAKTLGIKTGGTAPMFYRTEKGHEGELLKRYGLIELTVYDYASRTEKNVAESDATLRIARHFQSPGEQCTLRALRARGKIFRDVKEERYSCIGRDKAEQISQWLLENNVKVLNVAGNSERTAPGITQNAFKFLCILFEHHLKSVS